MGWSPLARAEVVSPIYPGGEPVALGTISGLRVAIVQAYGMGHLCGYLQLS